MIRMLTVLIVGREQHTHIVGGALTGIGHANIGVRHLAHLMSEIDAGVATQDK